MSPHARRASALGRVLSLTLFLLAGYAGAQASSAPRWSLSDAEGDAWIPSVVSLAAGDEWVLSGATGSHAGLVLLASGAEGEPQTLRSLPLPVTTTLRTAARERTLFAAAAFDTDTPGVREGWLWGMRPDLGPLAPAWLVSLGETEGGDLFLSAGAASDAVVTAFSLRPEGVVQLDWWSEEGALAERVLLPGDVLRGLDVSADGSRAAVLTGSRLFVVERGTGTLMSQSWIASPGGMSLSADGARLAAALGASVELFHDVGGAFVPGAGFAGGLGEVAPICRLSSDGARLVIGWWDATTGRGARFEARDVTTGERFFELEQVNEESLQNFPRDARLTPDGERAALAFWGGGGAAEVWLVDVATGAARLTADTSGSPYAVAVSDDGTRVAVAHKSTHANQFGSSGAAALYDTGERDLEVLGAPDAGGLLHLRHREGDAATWFVFGLEGYASVLALPATRADVDGAHLELPLVPTPDLIGLEIVSVAVTPGAFGPVWSAGVARPVVL